MRTARLIVLALIMLGAARPRSIAAQGAASAIGGLGELVGSFRPRNAYVGSVRVSLRQLAKARPRVQFHGFSVTPPAGAGWFLASSPEATADIVQTVWFVKDPHRFSAWAKGNRIDSRPRSVSERLRFFGRSDPGHFESRVRMAKVAEWNAAGVQMLALDTRPLSAADVECAEYEGRVIDRRAPPGFVEHPFLVVFRGRVCPHPAAPWLTVDIGHASRSLQSDPAAVADPAEAAFVTSLMFEAFHGPVVEQVLLLDSPERPLAAGNTFWMGGTVLAPGALWVDHRPDTLTRIDLAAGRIVAQVPVSGTVVGGAENGVWLTGDHEAWRVDAATNTVARHVILTCPTGMAQSGPLQAGRYGVWLACANPKDGKRSSTPLPALLLIRTLMLGSFACRYVAVAGDEAWILREAKGRAEIAKVDLTAGRVVAALPLPKNRFALGLAIGSDAVWVSTTTRLDGQPGGGDIGSTGGLIIVDRATARMRGGLVPTGTANRLIGVEGDTGWLYDSEGAVFKVRERH